MLETSFLLETAGTVLSLAYVILLMLNKVWAWPCGIVGSAIMGYTFVTSENPLYMDTVSYTVYTIMGVYGLWYWMQSKKAKDAAPEANSGPIVEWSINTHVVVVLAAAALAYGIGTALKETNEARPLLDSFTTVFALLGTWMQARKVLSNWLYWLVINAASIYLYWDTGFNQYSVLTMVFTVLSVTGYLQWRKLYAAQEL